ncbi:MAG: RNA methyltransferase [Spirochaetales bacterium]
MELSQARIVLCRPDESRNIGSVCRAMANMGMSHLRIVGKKSSYNEEHIKTLAIHASDIWNHAVFYDSLPEAVEDCVIVAGTTRRRGKKRKNALLLPEEFAHIASLIPHQDNHTQGLFAVVFGNERTGLTDEELSHCTMGVTIPTDPAFGSLNLSHAVQIIAYTLFREYSAQKNAKHPISPGYIPISLKRVHNATEVITDSLQSIGFFKQAGKEDMCLFWQNILTKAILSEGEATYLEKIFTKIAGLASKNKINVGSGDDRF